MNNYYYRTLVKYMDKMQMPEKASLQELTFHKMIVYLIHILKTVQFQDNGKKLMPKRGLELQVILLG